MEILQEIGEWVMSHLRLVIILLVVGVPILQSIVKGLAEARRRQQEVEEQRRTGGGVSEEAMRERELARERDLAMERMPEAEPEREPEPEPEPEPEEVEAEVRTAPPMPPRIFRAPPGPGPPVAIPNERAEAPRPEVFAEPVIALERMAPIDHRDIAAFQAPQSDDDWRRAVVLVEVLSGPVSMRRFGARVI